MSKTPLAGAALVLVPIALWACATGGGEARATVSPEQLTEAHAAFDRVYEVLQHPRCLNCHPAGNRPLQYDASLPHSMNVVRGDDDRGVAGMRCDGCHGPSNAPLPHMPPGVATGWRLAPSDMVFEGRSKAELAAQLADPATAHMTPEQLLGHVAHDPLVMWGWDPGPGREPVPVPHAEFVAAFATWTEAGCPVPPVHMEGTER